MVFILAGLGLNPFEIPIGTLKYIKKADYVFLEGYTSLYPYLPKIIKEKAKIVDRKFVEEELENFILKNKDRIIVLLTYGDPLSATTHISLIDFCKRNRIKYKVIQSSSIFNAIARTGLFLYKFGKAISISFHYSEVPYDVIKQNKSIDAHTLILLDLDPFENKFLTPKEALERLLEIENRRKENVIDVNEKVIVCQRLGWKDEKIFYENIKDFLKIKWEKPPWCIVIPSNLNPIEREFLENVRSPLREI